MRLLARRTILVASDLTPTSDGAIRTAVDLSRASGASLHAVHVAAGSDDRLAERGRRAEYVSALDVGLRRMAARESDFAVHVTTGDPTSSIGTVADKLDADVVILGRRRTDEAAMRHRPLGGTAYAVMCRSRAPCLAITEPLNLPIRQALVGHCLFGERRCVERNEESYWNGRVFAMVEYVRRRLHVRVAHEPSINERLMIGPLRATSTAAARRSRRRTATRDESGKSDASRTVSTLRGYECLKRE